MKFHDEAIIDMSSGKIRTDFAIGYTTFEPEKRTCRRSALPVLFPSRSELLANQRF
jgi:hypothetical protein